MQHERNNPVSVIFRGDITSDCEICSFFTFSRYSSMGESFSIPDLGRVSGVRDISKFVLSVEVFSKDDVVGWWRSFR